MFWIPSFRSHLGQTRIFYFISTVFSSFKVSSFHLLVIHCIAHIVWIDTFGLIRHDANDHK